MTNKHVQTLDIKRRYKSDQLNGFLEPVRTKTRFQTVDHYGR